MKEILKKFREQYEIELIKHEIELRTFKRENLVKADPEVDAMIRVAQKQVELGKARLDVIDTMLEENDTRK